MLLAIAILGVIYFLSGLFSLVKNSVVNAEVHSEQTMIYKDVFKKNIRDSIKLDNTFFYDYREPFSIFTYENEGNTFKILIWKYATRSVEEPLIITLTDSPNSLAINQVYQGVNASYYDVMVTKDSISKSNSMYLNLKGRDIIKKKDSTRKWITYSLVPEEISISNKKSGPEIWKIQNKLYSIDSNRVELTFFSDGSQYYLGFLFPLRKNLPNDFSLTDILFSEIL